MFKLETTISFDGPMFWAKGGRDSSGRFARNHEKLTRAIIGDALDRWGLDVVPLVKERAPANFGYLRASIQPIRQANFYQSLEMHVTATAPYAYSIETGEGVIGVWQPIGAIRQWVTRKFGIDGSHAWAVATIVRRNLHDRGYAPPHEQGWRMFSDPDVLNSAEDLANERLRQARDSIVDFWNGKAAA